jgi:hypothetical protein
LGDELWQLSWECKLTLPGQSGGGSGIEREKGKEENEKQRKVGTKQAIKRVLSACN